MSVRTQRNSLPLLCLNFKKTVLEEDWWEFFRDDFDDAILRSEWTLHNTDANRTIVEAGDVLTIKVEVGTDARWWGVNNNAPKAYMALPVIPPLEIITKINDFALEKEWQCGIFIGYHDAAVAPAPTGAYLFGPHYAGAEFAGIKVRKAPTGAYATIAGVAPIWLKIKVDVDEVITFWYSADGSAWTQYLAVEISGWYESDMEVGLFAQQLDVPVDPIATPFEFFLINVYEAQHPTEIECLAPIDTRASTTFYHGRIKQMSSLKRAVDDKTGLFQIADMSITLANEDKHYSQLMASRILKNQEAILYHTWTEEDPHVRTEIIKLIVDDHSMKGPDFIIKFKDITQKYFTKKVPEGICTKDYFPNIHPDYEGRCMPEILGNASLLPPHEHPGAVEAVCVDTTPDFYRYLASAGDIAIPTDEVWVDDVLQEEGALPKDYTIHKVLGRTYIYFNVGRDPVNATVTFNAHGYSVPIWDSDDDYIQNLAYIIQYYLRFIMDIPHALVNSPSFLTLAGYYEEMGVDENCYLILQDRVDAREVLRQLLFTGGAKGFMAMDGKFNVKRKDICNWEIDSNEHHIFEQIELFGSPDRKWNLTSAINTVNVEYGLIPWQNLMTGAKSEYKDNRYERPMEDRIRRERPEGRRRR